MLSIIGRPYWQITDDASYDDWRARTAILLREVGTPGMERVVQTKLLNPTKSLDLCMQELFGVDVNETRAHQLFEVLRKAAEFNWLYRGQRARYIFEFPKVDNRGFSAYDERRMEVTGGGDASMIGAERVVLPVSPLMIKFQVKQGKVRNL